ncbi:MAG: hypothetical protein FJ265_18535 [Planctomycetes bacterium]|nr:hypothetical protein [Planctomycetota bacterium]
MNAPTPEPRSEPAGRAARAFAAVAIVAVAVWLVALIVRAVPALATATAAAARGATEPAAARIQRSSGLSPALRAAIREHLPADGRLVLYSPYGGAAFELDATDPRGEPARQVRTLFERCKNLLYPHPRDVHFARDAAELATRLGPRWAGRLLAVDGTQGGAELAVGGRWQLLHTEPLGTGVLRLWRFQEAR